ncbi:unnamed protein product [Dibothriocephalus latus]|uniref:Uncharacterized protein n=1 Tax=Dibothriocephalus latus TaxID=60516 RepID=A0A3P6U5D7_DIBLA|nr:unnamed protein product [Dibothriocephalus latus]
MSMILREQLDENEKERNRDPCEIFDKIEKEVAQSGRQPETLGQATDATEETEKVHSADEKPPSPITPEGGIAAPNQTDNKELNDTNAEPAPASPANNRKSKTKRFLPQINNDTNQNHYPNKGNNEGRKARKRPPIKVYLADKSCTQVRPLSDHVVPRDAHASLNCVRKLPNITALHNSTFNPVPISHRRHLPEIRRTTHRRKLPFIGSIIENPLNTHDFEEQNYARFDNTAYSPPLREPFDLNCLPRKAGQWKEQRDELLDNNRECGRSTSHLSLLPKQKPISQMPRQLMLHDQGSFDSNNGAHSIMPPTLVRTETETSYLTSSLGNSPSPKYIRDDQVGLL